MIDHFGLFLFLSPNDNEALLPIITNLQKKHCSGPPFEPHLSIYHSVKMSSLAETISAVASATNNIKPFMVEADGIGYQEVWSKILYIKIKPNKILTTMRMDIGSELGDKEIRAYTPHISLMYKDKIPSNERSEIISNLDLPNTYTVQGIQIVNPGTSNDDWRDYTKWKVMHSIAFSK